jgi:protein TonB
MESPRKGFHRAAVTSWALVGVGVAGVAGASVLAYADTLKPPVADVPIDMAIPAPEQLVQPPAEEPPPAPDVVTTTEVPAPPPPPEATEAPAAPPSTTKRRNITPTTVMAPNYSPHITISRGS